MGNKALNNHINIFQYKLHEPDKSLLYYSCDKCCHYETCCINGQFQNNNCKVANLIIKNLQDQIYMTLWEDHVLQFFVKINPFNKRKFWGSFNYVFRSIRRDFQRQL